MTMAMNMNNSGSAAMQASSCCANADNSIIIIADALIGASVSVILCPVLVLVRLVKIIVNVLITNPSRS